MKISIRTIAIATAMGLGLAGGASAATLSGTGSGNDPFPEELEGSPALAKCETGTDGINTFPTSCSDWEDASSPPGAEGDYSLAFSLDYTDLNSFTWSFDPNAVTGTTNVLFPTKIAVKGGNGFEIWQLDASESTGGFIDSFLNDISHVSFYDTGLSQIPVPAAGWLLLAGIGGLAAMRRRKKA